GRDRAGDAAIAVGCGLADLAAGALIGVGLGELGPVPEVGLTRRGSVVVVRRRPGAGVRPVDRDPGLVHLGIRRAVDTPARVVDVADQVGGAVPAVEDDPFAVR